MTDFYFAYSEQWEIRSILAAEPDLLKQFTTQVLLINLFYHNQLVYRDWDELLAHVNEGAQSIKHDKLRLEIDIDSFTNQFRFTIKIKD